VPPVAVLVPPVTLLPLAVITPPLAVIVPLVALLPLAIIVLPVSALPLAVVVPPVAVLPLADAIPPNGSFCSQPPSPTFASHYHDSLVWAIHHLRHSRQWLVVAFSAHPAAYRLNHQAENVFMFSLLYLF